MDQRFTDGQIRIHGEKKATEWLCKIPLLIKKYEKKWDIKVGEVFSNIVFNYVAKAKTKTGEDVVLKIGFPGDKLFLSEAEMLKIYSGENVVKLLNENLEDCVLLLERCVPGNSLDSLNNETEETLIFSQICKKTWKKIPNNFTFPEISDDLRDFGWYFENYETCKDLIDKEIVKKAQEKFAYLVSTQKNLILLDSDLHHNHILQSKRGWLVIDCRGAIAEREYSVSHFIRNPFQRAEDYLITKDVIINRVGILIQELNLNKQRVIDWAFAQTVLAIIWTLQDTGSNPKYWVRIAKELEKLI